MKARCIAVIGAVVSIGGAAQAQNLLGNPGFESDTLFDVSAFDNPGNWVAFFGGPAGVFLESFNFVGAPPLSGAQAMQTTIGPGSAAPGYNAFTGQVQFVPGASAGVEYTFSIWARDLTNGAINGGAEFRIEFLDVNNNPVIDPFTYNTPIQDLLTTDYQEFAVSAIAPVGTASVQAVLAVQSFANDGVNDANISVAWDDASLIPAPGSAALLLGFAGLVSSRRRR